MAILTGSEIKKRLNKDIHISSFNRNRLNPNSYNLRLHNELLIYENETLDMKKENKTQKILIPKDGLMLYPGRVYLARTKERTITDNLVPMLEGRSSIRRLGLFIHVSAGFGDIGFDGFWTLELVAAQPIKIYPDMEICQIFYHTIKGDTDIRYEGKYQRNIGIQSSQAFKDFNKHEMSLGGKDNE